MNKVGYVVLHYQAYDETVACVSSITKKHGDSGTMIVVVDNASPNGSGKLLQNLYQDENDIEVLLLDENIGFAKGLNVGIRVLRNKQCDFIVLLNNDTELYSENWDRMIIKKFHETNFGVMGPDICSPDFSRHDNPAEKQDTSKKGLKCMMRNKIIDYFLYYTYLKPLYFRLKETVKLLLKYNSVPLKKDIPSTDTVDVQLQGSCLILSPKYLNVYKDLYPDTFLYFEEAILRYRCKIANMDCVYSPDIILIHKGSVSLKGSIESERKRRLFYLKHSYNSVKTFYSSVYK